jgi:hypothetical protein
VTKTIFHDKSMLFLVLIVAFFVGASATDAFIDDSFAANDDNNGNNGCENANPNAKSCEKNPNTVTCFDCGVALAAGYEACGVDAACNAIVIEAYFECTAIVLETTGDVCSAPPAPPRG